MGIGIALGTLSGFALRWFFTRGIAISNQTARLVSLTAVFACFVLSEHLGNESGILAVAIFGIILGTSEFPYKENIKEFKSDIVTVMLSLIFILLAAMLKFEDIQRIGVSGIVLVLLLIFFIRPMAVFVSMWNSRLKTNEKLFFFPLLAPEALYRLRLQPISQSSSIQWVFLEGRPLWGLFFLRLLSRSF